MFKGINMDLSRKHTLFGKCCYWCSVSIPLPSKIYTILRVISNLATRKGFILVLGVLFDGLFISGMTSNHVEEMIDFIFVIHCHLCITCVTRDWIVVFFWVWTFDLELFTGFLCLQRKLHLDGCIHRTVHDEHCSVLCPIDLVSLTVQAQHCNVTPSARMYNIFCQNESTNVLHLIAKAEVCLLLLHPNPPPPPTQTHPNLFSKNSPRIIIIM